jgi:hypothetical protein
MKAERGNEAYLILVGAQTCITGFDSDRHEPGNKTLTKLNPMLKGLAEVMDVSNLIDWFPLQVTVLQNFKWFIF